MSRSRDLSDLGGVTTRLEEVGNTDGALSNRNAIINGNMAIDQRNSGSAVSISSYGYGVDRFGFQCFGGGAWTSQQTTTAPTNFSHSLALTVTTADASIGSADVYQVFHKVEGYDVAELGFGTATAQNVTVSFWVRSSITGTYSISLQNSSFNRGYVSTVTVDAANVWEKKTITIAGDTSGTWNTTNGIGLQLGVDLGSGSASNIASGSWQTVSTSSLRTSGSVNWVSNAGATLYITGVQLEVGDTATPFEHRSYGQELALCQRYYQAFGAGAVGAEENTTQADFGITLNTPMRTNPSTSLRQSNIFIRLPSIAADRTMTSTINGATAIGPRGGWLYLDISGGVAGRVIIERSGLTIGFADAEL